MSRDSNSQWVTPREKEVVELICQGKINREIAKALEISEGSVKEYIHRVFRKLKVTNRTELAMWALRQKGD
jgi:DNA-binding NarL/FixJ family response regulator